MSKTVPVCFDEAMFWAYDVALGVLFAEAIHIAEETAADRRPPWWDDVVGQLRVHAVVGSSLAVLLHDFDVDQRQSLLAWLGAAGSRLSARGGVGAAEVSTWDVLDGETIHLRGADHVAPGPLVELARAFAELIDGTLEPAPEGRFWYFGTPRGRILQGSP